MTFTCRDCFVGGMIFGVVLAVVMVFVMQAFPVAHATEEKWDFIWTPEGKVMVYTVEHRPAGAFGVYWDADPDYIEIQEGRHFQYSFTGCNTWTHEALHGFGVSDAEMETWFVCGSPVPEHMVGYLEYKEIKNRNIGLHADLEIYQSPPDS